MIPAQVKIDIDQKEVQAYINEQLSKSINQSLLLADINRLAAITNMSKRFLEEDILTDPRIKQHERKKHRKRWWLYEPTIEAIKEIIDEW